MILRDLTPEDRPRIDALLSKVHAFTPDERDVALELVDLTIARSECDDYRFLLASPDDETATVLGYLCYGRTPMTCSSYDLYWVATAPEHARHGVAKTLVQAMERAIARDGGGLIRVETGSREGHGAAVRFYDALGFVRSALLEDFYAPGEHLLIFTRRIAPDGPGTSESPTREEALIDAAFGYRNYDAERDFFLACARRFGGREVRRALAWGCGAARHLASFADLGVAAIGVDTSERMIAHARNVLGSQPAGRSPRVELFVGPLVTPPEITPVDLSFVPLSGIHSLTSRDAMMAHLRSAAAVLAPSGVHVIDATHPLDLTPAGVHDTEWTDHRSDVAIHARLRLHIDRAIDRVVPVTLEVVCEPKKATPARSLPSLRREDTWLVPTLDDYRAMLAEVPELSLAAALGDFNTAVPFDHPAALRLLLVLRRA